MREREREKPNKQKKKITLKKINRSIWETMKKSTPQITTHRGSRLYIPQPRTGCHEKIMGRGKKAFKNEEWRHQNDFQRKSWEVYFRKHFKGQRQNNWNFRSRENREGNDLKKKKPTTQTQDYVINPLHVNGHHVNGKNIAFSKIFLMCGSEHSWSLISAAATMCDDSFWGWGEKILT